ncbi:tape measure protein [Fulvimonas yonginensis]|uniref:Tape measure protein n=1 Tax=Fulvimonas yonginensis TaxID=1495200 RepID=A0ABU8J9I8_9GAMM
MANANFPLKITIRGIDRVTAPLRAVQGAVERIGVVARRVNASVATVGARGGLPVIRGAIGQAGRATDAWGRSLSRLGRAFGGLTAAGAGFAYVFKTQFVDTAAEFERFRTILTTLEGSSAKADKSMAWISDFAAKTPYSMKEVTDQFVKLRAYGFDPTNGSLKTLGDTAAAMGKPLESAVEAIADAVTGENERLKEFGIKARAVGSKFVYEYTQDGQTMRVAADKNSRAAIQATLQAIWNQKYGGAMDKLSGTWGGMMSNLGDQWDRFKLLVMQNGVFDVLREKLSGLLAKVDAMAKSGALQKLAKAVGQKLTHAFERAWTWLQKLPEKWEALKKAVEPVTSAIGWLCDTFGTGNVVLAAVAGTLAAMVIPAIAATAVAVKALGLAILTTPIGWILAGLAAVAAAGIYIYRHWEPISRWLGENLFAPLMGALSAVKGFFVETWDHIYKKYGKYINAIVKTWEVMNPIALIRKAIEGLMGWLSNWNLGEVIRDKVAAIATYLPKWLQKKLGIADIAAAAPAAGAAPAGAATVARGAAQAARGGESRLLVDFTNLPKGVRVTSEQRGAAPEMQVNQGYAMAGVW